MTGSDTNMDIIFENNLNHIPQRPSTFPLTSSFSLPSLTITSKDSDDGESMTSLPVPFQHSPRSNFVEPQRLTYSENEESFVYSPSFEENRKANTPKLCPNKANFVKKREENSKETYSLPNFPRVVTNSSEKEAKNVSKNDAQTEVCRMCEMNSCKEKYSTLNSSFKSENSLSSKRKNKGTQHRVRFSLNETEYDCYCPEYNCCDCCCCDLECNCCCCCCDTATACDNRLSTLSRGEKLIVL
ncbi:UNVERIFIED_CONTAM: hypothetical protein RMT77_013271 [Armadillidium vulgare]